MKDGIEIEIKRARWEILKMMYNMKSPEVSRFVSLASMGREFKSVFEKVGREERRDQFSKVHTFLNSKRVFLKMLNYQVVARVACALAFPVSLLQ